MNRIALMLLPLLASCVFAQDGITRGDALRRREFQTYGTVSLFVDPAGNDSNACTSSGAANACLTVQGALDKLPRIIRHAVTVSVAAGTYAGFVVGDRVFSPAGTGSNPTGSITVAGSKRNATPTTGTATGTLTGVSGSSSSGTTVLIDSGQTWTVSDPILDGAYVRITSGVQSGQTRAIVRNGSTTLEVYPALFPTPSVSDTYVIEVPAVILNSGVIVRAMPHLNVVFTDLEIQSNSSSSAAFTSQGNLTTATLNGVRAYNTSTSVAVNVGRGASTSLTSGPLVAKASGGTALIASQSFATNGGVYAWSVTSTAARIIQSNSPNGTGGTWLSLYARTDAANQIAADIQQLASTSSGSTLATLYVRCGSTTGTTGLALTGTGGQLTLYAFSDGCSTGFNVGTPQQTYMMSGGQFAPSTLSCTTAATCVTVASGGRAKIPVPVLSSVTNAYNIDGVNYSEATFAALSPPRIVGSNLSVLER